MVFLIPTILFYTVYSYYVFRGKVTGAGISLTLAIRPASCAQT